MSNLSYKMGAEYNKKPAIVGLSEDAKGLIERFERNLKHRLLDEKFRPKYSSIKDILIKKFHLSDLDNLDFPDYKEKSLFITNGVRGNLQKIDGNVLSYSDGEDIINEAINIKIP